MYWMAVSTLTSSKILKGLRLALKSTRTVRFLVFLAIPVDTSAQEKLVRYRDVVTTPVGTFSLPVELYLKSMSETEISIKFAANLTPVQKKLPQLLSAFLVDECDLRIGLQVDGSKALADQIQIDGRLQSKVYACGKNQNKENRLDLVTLDFDIQAALSLSVVRNCVRLSLDELVLTPTNLASEIVAQIGFLEKMHASARSSAEEYLESYSGCMEFPEPLRVVNAQILSAGIRDFEDGDLGVVVKGSVDTRSDQVIELLVWLFERGHLEPEDGTDIGSFTFRAVDILQ